MIFLRDATHADLPAILEIYNEIILNTTAVYDYEPHTLAMRTAWFETKIKDNFPVYVATEEDKIVGFAALGPFRAWAAYQYTVENSVYVAAADRGKGIGSLLLSKLIGRAIELKFHVILAGIDASNESSIRLHEAFGFKQVALFPEVGYKFNRWLDLAFLQLTLPVEPVQ